MPEGGILSIDTCACGVGDLAMDLGWPCIRDAGSYWVSHVTGCGGGDLAMELRLLAGPTVMEGNQLWLSADELESIGPQYGGTGGHVGGDVVENKPNFWFPGTVHCSMAGKRKPLRLPMHSSQL